MALMLRAAERGQLPDFLVRYGMRRLLDQRARESASVAHSTSASGFSSSNTPEDSHLQEFLRATQAQPIAVCTRAANEQHYELPAEFFELMLGPHRKYSCGYWNGETDVLDEAEQRALEQTCQHANLADGQRILELGCGWGSLSLWMARHYPQSRITAVSNSHSQREFIASRAAQDGLGNLQVVTADINDFSPEQTYDRVVSVEMFEHVRNHQKLLNRIHDWLTPHGQLLVHIFCHRDRPYLFRSDGPDDWMGKHFFTGGMMPSRDLLPQCGSRLQLDDQWTWNGMHYARTCRAWLDRFDSHSETATKILKQVYGDPDAAQIWLNRWRMFLMACEELFSYGGGNTWFVSHYLFTR